MHDVGEGLRQLSVRRREQMRGIAVPSGTRAGIEIR
jgi:hypothetical protein